jgi:hypothetical protein
MTIPLLVLSPTGSTYYDMGTNVNQIAGILNNLGTYDHIDIIGGDITDVAITNGTINGTYIDGSPIGENTPSNGFFNSLTVNTYANLSNASLSFSDGQILGDWVGGGTIGSADTVMVLLSGPPTLSNHATTKAYVDSFMAMTNSFTDIKVHGQSDLIASSPNSILTFAAGANIVLTTGSDSDGDLLTISTNLGALANLSTIGDSLWAGIPLGINHGGTGAATVNQARLNLGLGTSAQYDAGTSPNQMVQLNSLAQLPAVSGANLTNLPIPVFPNVAAQNGKLVIGPITFQWGVSPSSLTATVTFGTAFSAAPYYVGWTGIYTGSGGNFTTGTYPYTHSITSTGFIVNGGTSGLYPYNWIAIGPT